MTEVEVSIIISAYNEEKEISDCIISIINSNYPKEKYEVIVVDDGSSDKTGEIVQGFVNKYSNVVLLSKENGGKGSGQNFGIKHTKGYYILITDADAVVDENWILKMVNDLKKYDMVIGLDYAKDTDSWWGKIYNANELIRHKFDKKRKVIPAIGASNGFRKEVAEKIGGFSESKTSVTEDFLKRAKESDFNYYFNPNNIVFVECTKSIRSFIEQKLRWREISLTWLKAKKITFQEVLRLGYTIGLSFVLLVSLLLSLLFLNYQYFIFSFITVYMISFLLFINPLMRMYNNKKSRYYTKYFIVYLLLEVIVRMVLIPYLIYRMISPRKRPTFKSTR